MFPQDQNLNKYQQPSKTLRYDLHYRKSFPLQSIVFDLTQSKKHQTKYHFYLIFVFHCFAQRCIKLTFNPVVNLPGRSFEPQR